MPNLLLELACVLRRFRTSHIPISKGVKGLVTGQGQGCSLQGVLAVNTVL